MAQYISIYIYITILKIIYPFRSLINGVLLSTCILYNYSHIN